MQPDVVIASDDNASRYVIEPYYRESDIPFVFCGVNWSAEKYGFPYPNVTGMLEIISIDPLLKVIQTVLPDASSGIFIGGDVPSTRSNYERYKKAFSSRGIDVRDGMVTSFDAWKQNVSDAQETADFIILANKAGIVDWNQDAATTHVRQNIKRFTVGHHEFMVTLNMFSMTKIPQEQGEWAAKVAIKILEGSKPSEIPIVANRRWNIYANTGLLDKAGIQLPANILRKAGDPEGLEVSKKRLELDADVVVAHAHVVGAVSDLALVEAAGLAVDLVPGRGIAPTAEHVEAPLEAQQRLDGLIAGVGQLHPRVQRGHAAIGAEDMLLFGNGAGDSGHGAYPGSVGSVKHVGDNVRNRSGSLQRCQGC